MRILLIGKNGQVGWELQRSIATLGEIVAVDYPELDLGSTDSTREFVRKVGPRVIINAAAFTNVDKAESEEELAYAINSEGPKILAEEAKRLGAALIHYSTDFIFDGQKGKPYIETDIPNPLNLYGKSKLAGERAVQTADGTYLIFRTSWVYSLRQVCFVTRVLQWTQNQKAIRVVIDQIGSPTWCRMLAEATTQILAMGNTNIIPWLDERKGIYHLAGNGSASRFEWAQEILNIDSRAKEQSIELLPALTASFPAPAIRPYNSSLNCDHFRETFGFNLPDWKIGLYLAMHN